MSLTAQEKSTKHKENFFGLGRAVVSNETMHDTTSKQSDGATTNGYTLFDLGVKMRQFINFDRTLAVKNIPLLIPTINK